MFGVEKFSTLEIRFYKATKENMDALGVKSWREIYQQGHFISFICESNQKTKAKADENAYEYVNEYIQYRGDDFINELFTIYEEIKNHCNAYAYKGNNADRIAVKKRIQRLAKLVDINEVYKYLTDINKLPIPAKLPEEFNNQNETDGIGSRDQTYTVGDYKDLMAVLVMLKFIYPVLEEMMSTLDDNLKNHLTIQMINEIKELPEWHHPGFDKLIKYVTKIISGMPKEDLDSKILSLLIPNSSIVDYFLGELLFGKIAFINTKNTEIEVVTGIYNDINTKMKNKGDSSNRYRNNTKPREAEDSVTDKESVAESYRMSSDITRGLYSEINWIGEMSMLRRQLRFDIDENDFQYASKIINGFDREDISTIHFNLVCIVAKMFIHPVALTYHEFDSIKNQLIIGYCVLKKLGNEVIANILISKRMSRLEEQLMEINVGFENRKLKGYREEELFKYYPIKRVIAGKGKKDNTYEYIITDWINDTSEEIKSCKWFPPEGISQAEILVPDLKSKLVDMLISVEEFRLSLRNK